MRWIGYPTFFGVLIAGSWALFTNPMGPVSAPESLRRADPARLERDVDWLASLAPARSVDHPDSLSRAADYIEKQWQQTGLTVERQELVALGHPYTNLVASWGPPAAEHLVIGAHYDVYGDYPGADDNASGVAGLLELGRLLSGERWRNTRVDLVAFTLEEPPFFATDSMGSAVHARSLADHGAKVLGMISLEMIGYFSDEPGSQSYPLPVLRFFYPSAGNFIAVSSDLADWGFVRRVKRAMRQSTRLPVLSFNGPRWLTGVDWSDHRNYWRYGWPAAMVTDSAFYRNRAYHTAGDTAQRLDFRRLAQVIEGVAGLVVSSDQR
jgi:hypothetical protein